jgi:hypothetical protein
LFISFKVKIGLYGKNTVNHFIFTFRETNHEYILTMQLKGEAKLLRIFLSSTDKFKHQPLYEVIVFADKRYGLTGATVLKGVMGFGASSAVYSPTYWEITEKVPMVVRL